MTTKESLKHLIAGNKRFFSGNSTHPLQDRKRIHEIKNEQNPFAIVLSCSDSRVVPEMAFDTGLGELFVIRVAGNVANTSSIASIEYALIQFAVPLIVVLGHQNCGAVIAALGGGDNGHNLNHLLAHIAPAINKSKSNVVDEVVKTNSILTARDLMERSPIISEAVKQKKVEIRAAFYQLTDGKVIFLD